MGLGRLNPTCDCCDDGESPSCVDFDSYDTGGLTSVTDLELINFYTSGGSACCEDVNYSWTGGTMDYSPPIVAHGAAFFEAIDAVCSGGGVGTPYTLLAQVAITCGENGAGEEDDTVSISVTLEVQTSAATGSGTIHLCTVERDFAAGEFLFGVPYTISDSPDCTVDSAGSLCFGGFTETHSAIVTIGTPA